MTSSRLVDNSDNCNIIKKFLVDDLLPYTIASDGGSLKYNDSDIPVSITNRLDIINTLIDPSYTDNGIWYPIIINNDNNILYKELSDDGSYKNTNTDLVSGRIGIENFITFSPRFNSFDTSTGAMVIDWILNRPNSVLGVHYGIMCWIKFIDTTNPMVIGGSKSALSAFPNGSRLQHEADTTKIYIKINDSQLYLVNNNRYTFNTSNVNHADENTFIIQASTLTPDAYKLADKINIEQSSASSVLNINQLSYNNKSYTLWIPDGDFLSYFTSKQEQVGCFSRSIPSQSFVSPCLHAKYNAIYRMITLDELRTFEPKNLVRSRCYRKIAQALSTSPFIDDFSINSLDNHNIRSRIQSYISSASSGNLSLTDEIVLLKSVLIDISKILQKTITVGSGTQNDSLYLDTKSTPYNLNTNIINNRKDLFVKLMNKYGANLVMTSSGQLTAKNNLITDNAGIVVTQNASYYCDKTLTNTDILNNQTIRYGNINIKTNITNTSVSTIEIQNSINNNSLLSIPLYDIAKGSLDSTKAYFCPRLAYGGYIPGQFMDNGGTYNPVYDPNNPTDVISDIYAMATKSKQNGSENEQDAPTNILPDAALYSSNTNGDEDWPDSGPELDAINIVINRRDSDIMQSLSWHETYYDNQNQYYWTIISEPEPESCKFEELTGGSLGGGQRAKTDTASSRYVRLKVKYSGKYIINCQLVSPYGTYNQQKTIYVTNGADKIVEEYSVSGAAGIFIRYKPNPFKNKYFNHETKTYEAVPIDNISSKSIIIPLNADKLRVTTSRITKLAISNIGQVVVPIDTSFTVKELIGSSMGGGGPISEYAISKLDDIYKFQWSGNYTFQNNAIFYINYDLNNTIVKIRSVYLEKIRSSVAGCEQCYSLYEPKLRSYKSTASTGASRVSVNRLSRINKFPEGFTLYEFEIPPGGSVAQESKTPRPFAYPIIRTNNAPRVKAGGGYSRSFINTLQIDNVQDALGINLQPPSEFDRGYVANSPTILPDVEGFPLNNKSSVASSDMPLLCYQKAIPYAGGPTMTFSKGVMHPNSGWFPYTSDEYAIHANRSSVLKFNPGARKTFSFVGPKIEPLINKLSDISIKKTATNTFSSTITLNMAQEIQWDPACFCGEAPSESYFIDLYNQNQLNKEYVDISTNISDHGYRYLCGGEPKRVETTATRTQPTVNDEFYTDQQDNEFVYSFAVTGPSSLPENVTLPDGKRQVRIPAINSFAIQDIEIKLNFLNYVNTKNLVIWLESDIPTASYGEEGMRKIITSNIKANKNFIDQSIATTMEYDRKYSSNTGGDLYSLIPNSGVASYLDNLLNTLPDEVRTESTNEIGDQQYEEKYLRTLLLNQEYIQNKNYGFSVKFSDRSSKFNVLCDHYLKNRYDIDTITNTGVFIPVNKNLFAKMQNIIDDNQDVNPTVAANSYSDRQACYYSSILKYNKLNITSRSLNKFQNHTIFTSSAQPGPACEGGAPKQKEGTFNGKRSFTLKMMIVDEQDEMGPNDMLVCNEYLTGIETAEKKQKAVNFFNSLCNWELILHVGPVPKPVPYTNPNLSSYGNCDVLSLINYDKDPQYPGYSFIADLKNYKHLLPIANIDAPNTAIADTSVCLGDKNDPVGNGFVVKSTPFPTHAIVAILASLFGGTTGTLVGTSTVPGAGYNTGFNAITSWLSESRFIRTLEDTGRQIYAPSYSKYPFGSPEKILLNIKKPGSLWHSLEAVIMKYWNTPILKPTKFNYIKVQRGVGKYISEFTFKNISDYNELLDTKSLPDIVASCDDINNITTFPAVLNNNIIHSGDLVNISVTGTEPVQCSGGLYVASSGLIRITNGQTTVGGVPSIGNLQDLSKATSLLSSNIILSSNNSLFDNNLEQNIKDNKVISISSRIPYDIFSINNTVECYSKSDRLLTNTENSSIANFTITNKALILRKNQLETILILDNAITSQDTLSPSSNSNILFVYKSQSTIDDKKINAYSVWGLDGNKNVTDTVPHVNFSAHSIGSYGNISPFLNKNLLDSNFKYNKLKNIYEILNQSSNDRISYNTINLYTEDNIPINNFKNNQIYGFNYSLSDLQDNIYLTNKNNQAIRSENHRQVDSDFGDMSANLLKQIDKSVSSNEKSKSFMYVVMPDANGSVPTGSGYMTLENEFEEYIPLEFLSPLDILKLETRLNTIDSTDTDTTLEAMIGDTAQTGGIIASSKLKYLLQHLRTLKDDPGSCHSSTVSDRSICYKLKTQDAITKITIERSNIIKLLDEQCVKEVGINYVTASGEKNITGRIVHESFTHIVVYDQATNSYENINKKDITNTIITYIRKCDLATDDKSYISPNILPKIRPKLTNSTNGGIEINYERVNLDHYWINIDPKQSCIVDFASNPKILKKTAYKCVRANETLVNQFVSAVADNNICPEFARQKQIPGGGVEKFSVQDEYYVYEIPQDVIDQQKIVLEQKFGTAIPGWREYIKERFFNINEDPGLNPIVNGDGNEVTVMVKETYLIPIIASRQSGFVSENPMDYSADTNIAPGAAKCTNGTNYESAGGLGLMKTDGTRVGYATRVENIFNLSDINEIEVQIKRIPRLLRGCDLLSTVYRYGNRNIYRPINNLTPKIPFEIDFIGFNGAINNSLYCWKCLESNAEGTALKYANLPPFFQQQNEMIFRSLFGSVDRIENRDDMMVSYYPWELIPYEY